MKPYKSKRLGMRVIRVDFEFGNPQDKDYAFCSTEVITNAYGNGFVNNKPDDKFCTAEQWQEIISEAKLLDVKPESV